MKLAKSRNSKKRQREARKFERKQAEARAKDKPRVIILPERD